MSGFIQIYVNHLIWSFYGNLVMVRIGHSPLILHYTHHTLIANRITVTYDRLKFFHNNVEENIVLLVNY